MLVSYNWLKTLIDVDLSVDQINDLLTNTGLEVEKVHISENVRGGLKGLVVGEVITCTPHPDADRLSVTTVNIGSADLLQIVCGAPNVAVGQKVVVAPVGCTIYPKGFHTVEIKKAKIRGVHSEGMICAQDEIGLGDNHDGILVLDEDVIIGKPVSDYFDVQSDHQIEIGLTPNRGDAASHLGVARDIKAITGAEVHLPKVSAIDFKGNGGFEVQIANPDMCPRYTGILLNNITVGPSPEWLKKKLQSIDLKPINNVVDVTNFVLHELGQPIHAFDAEVVANRKIIVRPAAKGEKMTTLDGTIRTFTGEEMLITDPEKALAIAGVFGGLQSGVNTQTKSVFIESAYFNPGTVRKSAKTHGLSTDASFRYERGCDPEITVYALQRVVDLLKETAGAEVASAVIDIYPKPLMPISINLDLKWLNRFCGTDISKSKCIEILTRLDFKIDGEQGDIIQITAPLYRSDVTRNVDVAEEILRIYGYNQVDIPSKISFTPSVESRRTMLDLQNKIADFLNGIGFLEMMNNSQNRKEDADENAVELLNPLSAELAVMRTSLLPGALTSFAHNINRKNKDLSFYEFGKTYLRREDKFIEIPKLLLVSTGSSAKSNWITPSSSADYFYLSGLTKALCEVLSIPHSVIKKAIKIDEVDAKTLKKFDVKQKVWSADINLELLHTHFQKAQFKLSEIPVYPIVVRDISAVVDKEVKFKDIELIVKDGCGKYFRELSVFDVYEGEHLPEGKKSYAFSIQLYNSEQTMTDAVTDAHISKVIHHLEKELGAIIRK